MQRRPLLPRSRRCSVVWRRGRQQPTLLDDEPQEGHVGDVELTSVLKQASQNQTNMLHVSTLCLREYQDIIQIDEEELVQHVAEIIIDTCLEHGWSVRVDAGEQNEPGYEQTPPPGRCRDPAESLRNQLLEKERCSQEALASHTPR